MLWNAVNTGISENWPVWNGNFGNLTSGKYVG